MSGACILLVEDDRVLRELVASNLEARKHEVHLAADGESALLQLQEIDGDGPKLPVVVLSAVQVSPRRLAEFRPLAYLPKPFLLDSLLRLAAEAAQRKVGGAATRQPESEHSSITSSNTEELHA
jgi:DNA-binding response OmpR family regulator